MVAVSHEWLLRYAHQQKGCWPTLWVSWFLTNNAPHHHGGTIFAFAVLLGQRSNVYNDFYDMMIEHYNILIGLQGRGLCNHVSKRHEGGSMTPSI